MKSKKTTKIRKITLLSLIVFFITFLSISGYYLVMNKIRNILKNNDKKIIYTSNYSFADGKKYYIVYDGESYVITDINVTDYGADPTGEKDSSDAFTKALQRAQSCSGNNGFCSNLVFVPHGTYRLKKNIQLRDYTGLIGEGVDNTFLYIYHGEGTPEVPKNQVNDCAIYALKQSLISNLSFYYPNQKIDSKGEIKSYPPTIIGIYGMEIKNVNFINSYIAIDLSGRFSEKSNNSLFLIHDIKGTPLKAGIINDGNLDTIRIKNISFNSSYWNKKDGTNQNTIKNALLKNKATGIEFGRTDWAFLSKINIQDYYNGIYLRNSIRVRADQPSDVEDNGRKPKDAEGELFDSYISATYPINIYNSRHFVVTSSKLVSTNNGIGFYVQDIGSITNDEIDKHDKNTDYSIYNTEILGNNAISFGSTGDLSITDSIISGKITQTKPKESKISIMGSKLTNTGMDDCGNNGGATYTKPENYSNPVERRVSLKNIEYVTTKFTASSLQGLINKVSQNGGGIVYIPSGIYELDSKIKIPSGVTVLGATPWMHNGSLLYDNNLHSTRIKLTKQATIEMGANSEINGLEIYSDDVDKYLISGNGDNIYIRNISLGGVKNGINIVGNKFLVENIWGAAKKTAINVTGNNGLIRNCHITKNARLNSKNTLETEYLNSYTYQIKGDKNTIYDCFTFRPEVGFSFDSATNFTALGIGSDSSTTAVSAVNSSGSIINPLLVSNKKTQEGYYIYGEKLKNSFNIINPILWSSNEGTRIVLKGTADVHMFGGILEKFQTRAIINSNKYMTIAGVIFKYVPIDGNKNIIETIKLQLDSGAIKANAVGNICNDWECSKSFKNNSNAIFTVIEPGKCGVEQNGQGIGEAAFVDNTPYLWEKLSLSNTTINKTKATTTICNLGSAYNEFIYYTNNNNEKKANITNGCANVELNASTNLKLNYKLKSNNKITKVVTVDNIGKYLIYAQVYNKLLYIGSKASNNSSNLGGWVNKTTDVSANVMNIGIVAATNSNLVKNSDFVDSLYYGILGRKCSDSERTNWVNKLKDQSRTDVLKGFVESAEAKAIYKAWGYK